MSILPDWNSLDSVRRAHSELEAAALVFFALLVLFDVLAHLSKDKPGEMLLEKIALVFFGLAVFAEIAAFPYGQRNDTLSEQIISSLDLKAQRAADNASKAVTDSSTALSQAKDALTKAGDAKTAAGVAAGIASTAGSKARSVQKRADLIAKEENRIGWYLNAVSKQIDWRGVDIPRFVESMKGKPRGTAEIWYVPDDLEAEQFAFQLKAALGSPNGAGWGASEPQPLPILQNSDLTDKRPKTLLRELRSLAVDGLSIASQELDLTNADNPAGAFNLALQRSITTKFFSIQATENSLLPKNHIVVVVGHRTVRVAPFKMDKPNP